MQKGAAFMMQQITTKEQHQSHTAGQVNNLPENNSYPSYQPMLHHKEPMKSIKSQKIKYLIIIILILSLLLAVTIYSLRQEVIHTQSTQPQYKQQTTSQLTPSAPLCRNYLAYNIQTLRQPEYLSWYGKVGTSTFGKKFESGHFIQRHIAVGGKCTNYQIQERKSVFKDYDQMLKALSLEVVSCDFGDSNKFTYDMEGTIANPSSFIQGYDCSKAQAGPVFFSKFFIQYKRTVKNPQPSDKQYMSSTKTIIWTYYPKR